MTTEDRIAKAFRLNDIGWARHANPWSGWTRFVTCLPLLVVAIWSRTWMGYWSLVPVVLAVAWIWLNPRAFDLVSDDSAWISKGVFGERFWSGRHRLAVPERHRVMPNVLNIASLSGIPFLAWGLTALAIWPTLIGLFLMIGAKLWYIDRMAILYEDMVSQYPEMRYRMPKKPS